MPHILDKIINFVSNLFHIMDYLSLIKQPINNELNDFIELFNKSLSHTDGLLSSVLEHIKSRGGKRMRPLLILLMAKNFGEVSDVTQHAAVGLELLHTASLVHDDVVDESNERRGQASVNAEYNNKVAVLVGDYLLSTALLAVSYTHSEDIVRYLAELGRTLSNGEILQLSNISNQEISEEVYYQIINNKTAALFEACARIGAKSAGASDDEVQAAGKFGQNLGIIFQIRDDIFDYYDKAEIGKPTGNDMAEGKLTLPVIYALNSTGNEEMIALAQKVKTGNVSADEIARLVAFTKENGGIEYAQKRMLDFHRDAMLFLDNYGVKDDIKAALKAYLDFVIERKS
jgi:octaprenyl-diphosphate synthase